jgi:hypothetical protein
MRGGARSEYAATDVFVRSLRRTSTYVGVIPVLGRSPCLPGRRRHLLPKPGGLDDAAKARDDLVFRNGGVPLRGFKVTPHVSRRRACKRRTPQQLDQGEVDASTARHLMRNKKEINMLWTIAILLLVLWGLGLVTSYTLGGFIHILIVAAVVLVLVRLIQGRRIA